MTRSAKARSSPGHCNAVIYIRVSTKDQVQNQSLPTQLKACQQYCNREGWGVVAVFEDAGESAKTADRPGFQRMLEFCRTATNHVKFVVVFNLTRFSRNTHDFVVVRTLLQRCGVSLRSATEPLTEDPVGTLTANILAAIGQFDNDEKARRTTVGMKAALDLGRWPFKPPLGYLVAPEGDGRIVPDPVAAPLIREAFETFAGGEIEKNAVLRRATAAGLRTARGRPLTAQSFSAILKNPIYAGWVNVPTWGISRRGDFAPVVPDQLFRRVQRRLEASGAPARPHARDNPDFPLRRFVRCGACRTPLTASWSRGRNSRYAYYHCRRCPAVKVRKDTLESKFVELLQTLRPVSAYMRLFGAIVTDVWRQRHVDAEATRARMEAVVYEKRRRLDRLDEVFVFERRIDEQTYKRQRDLLRDELALAETELNEAVIEHLDVEGVLAFAEHLLADAARLWVELRLEQKQQLQKALFPEGLEFDGEQFGTAATAFVFKDLAVENGAGDGLASPPGFEPGFWP